MKNLYLRQVSVDSEMSIFRQDPSTSIMNRRPPLISITLLSASALGYEILLIHLYAIISYQYLAYMIISLALLGYGMSGTCLSIWRKPLSRFYPVIYLACLILFGCSVPGSFLLAQEIPFNGEELLWDKYQMLYLSGQFLLLMLPFFFAAMGIGLTFSVYSHRITTIYGYDLGGAGIGSLLIIVLLFLLQPKSVLVVIGCIGLLAALVACREVLIHCRKTVAIFVMILMTGMIGAGLFSKLKISPYKSLMSHLRIEGNHVIDHFFSPLGVLHVVESTIVPFRHAPGLSFTAEREPLEQIAVFTNGDNLSVITKRAEKQEQLSYFDQVTSALPYHLKSIDNVLILGVGGGGGILQAKYHGVKDIEGVELNGQMITLLTDRYMDYSGFSSVEPGKIHTGDIRGFINQTGKKYDLIQLSLTDSFSPTVSGLSSLRENYLYTVEALQEYMKHLSEGGYLAITRWVKNPPRDTLKILVTAVSALSQTEGINMERQLLLIHSWQTSTILIKNSDFTAREIRQMETFCYGRSFDVGYSFLTTEDQVNIFNVLNEPLFFQAADAILSGKGDSFIDSYKFDIRSATDDRPYFYHFFKWSSLREILALHHQGGMALLESSYLVLLSTLLLAVVFSVVLIIVPLAILKRQGSKNHDIESVSLFLYFFLAGIGFLFIEISFIQKFTLYLYHPVYSIGVSLASFLTFAGIGSQLAGKLTARFRPVKILIIAVSGLLVLCISYLIFMDNFFLLTASFSLPAKLLSTLLLIAPLAILMGMPFPLALGNLVGKSENMIPWGWGINGCASVISAMSAPLIAIHFGFSVVLSVALVIYPLLYLFFPESEKM